jgi:hypothetical protein
MSVRASDVVHPVIDVAAVMSRMSSPELSVRDADDFAGV